MNKLSKWIPKLVSEDHDKILGEQVEGIVNYADKNGSTIKMDISIIMKPHENGTLTIAITEVYENGDE